MITDRHCAVFVSCGVACALLVGLFLGIGNVAHGEGDSVNGASREEFPLAGVMPQSSGSFTTVLPLVTRNHPPPPPVFGAQLHAVHDSGGLQQALDAGVYWARLVPFHWDQIEPLRTDPPTYHWGVVDEAGLVNAHDNGLQAIAIVLFTPSWAQKYPGSYCGPIRQDRLDEFAQFLTALVNRYKDYPYKVKYWELGNEPDAPLLYSHGLGCWGIPGDPYFGGRYYGEMLKYAYPAIKAADPGAQVLIGGLLLDRPAGGADTSPRFLEGILEGGGGPYFDVVSFHAYAYYGGSLGQIGNPNWPGSVTAVPEKVSHLRDILGRYGYGGKGFMNTEAALHCLVETTGCLDTQAMYVPRAYAEALALGLRGQVYFAITNEERFTGLLRPDLTPRPVYYAYQTAAGFLSDVDYVGPVTGYPAGIEGYTFQKRYGSGYLDVVWSADGSSIIVFLDAGEAAYDRYGYPPSSPSWVEVNYAPVYIERS